MSIFEIVLLVILSPVIIFCSGITLMLLLGIVLAAIDGSNENWSDW